jgi:hypothetical protein
MIKMTETVIMMLIRLDHIEFRCPFNCGGS